MLYLTRLLLAILLSVQIMATVHAAEHVSDHDHKETCQFSVNAYDPLSSGCEVAIPVFQISYIAVTESNFVNHYFSYQAKGAHSRAPPHSP